MQGLVKEVKAYVVNPGFGDGRVRDAILITQYKRI